jgi:hypothetical protein
MTKIYLRLNARQREAPLALRSRSRLISDSGRPARRIRRMTPEGEDRSLVVRSPGPE